MATVLDVRTALESFAPPSLSESWDNVGLLLGADGWAAARVLLTIDLTERVLEEAIAARAGLVITYHPPIFAPLKRITDAPGKERIVLGAARAGVAIHCPHTALDACSGGVNDWLAEGLGRGDVRALGPHEALPPSQACKIVTFAPADAVDRIRRALSTVGAGKIGEYELCSFEITGEGTFLPSPGAQPAIGRPGQLERVREIRLEMVCSEEALGLAAATLRQFHPYEEPAMEIHRLRAHPLRNVGIGRRLVLDQPVALPELVARVKAHLGVPHVLLSEGRGTSEDIAIIGVCAGSGGALLDTALAQGCRCYFSGEMGHHDVLKAHERGCAVILAGHTNTERGYLGRLRERLSAAVPGSEFLISSEDREPLRVG
jgi:dinuclear metal center YbgI/SA1388 family protein